jgi:3-keto-5-aminohexanoate cleavage enzyme
MSKDAKTPASVNPFAMTKEIVNSMFPVDTEPKIPTMDRPLLIESACPGFQMAGPRYPAIPVRMEDQVRVQAESLKAGAVISHMHPRDPKTGEARMDHRLLAQIMDGVFDEVGDFISFTHSWYPVAGAEVDLITGTEELLQIGGGNKYVQGTLLNPIRYTAHGQTSLITEKVTLDGLRWLNDHDVKPVYQLLDTYSHLAFKRVVFDKGLDRSQPLIMNIQLGKHDATPINVDPWSHLQLISIFHTIRENVPGCLIGIYAGGRNWLPMTVMGMLLGADIVRVGIEDAYWMYPHRDDIIKSNVDVVKMAVDLAGMLGRRVVTDADEARGILGIKLTSAKSEARPKLTAAAA